MDFVALGLQVQICTYICTGTPQSYNTADHVRIFLGASSHILFLRNRAEKSCVRVRHPVEPRARAALDSACAQQR